MRDDDLLRYSRHVLLDEIGIEGQQRLLAARMLIVGAGGLGSPAALYLASAGVGHLVLADGDTVDLSNLQRQILHRADRVGVAKAISGQQTLADINPHIVVDAIASRLEGEALAEQVAAADVVLDCCDNFATRQAINRACVRHRTPLVSGAAIRFSGQLAVFDRRDEDAPCYECLFPEGDEVNPPRCATTGVFAPLTGVIGALQAAEALRLVIGCGDAATGRLLRYDALRLQWRESRLIRDPGCPVCGH
ncbi:HesA/MoeB/ThiF family protein [Rhodocyclus gracilis]|uniref:Molybdopterin-synthase adenylyltransferase n=1 Tax=Rhodocyclus tenuis TaxID=1066 RepID=A0A6L5JTJ5_RHOTE|nr:molybdopterin-synthase adenylyltransferase MoeB [Rhodocyclus gracilis]MQY50707.1 molybdopterin-synthase adenylyltransferase MoeB [Rhodocyclus gracilis]